MITANDLLEAGPLLAIEVDTVDDDGSNDGVPRLAGMLGFHWGWDEVCDAYGPRALEVAVVDTRNGLWTTDGGPWFPSWAEARAELIRRNQ